MQTFRFVICIWLRTLWKGKILLLWFTHWLYQRWIIVIPYSLGSPMSSWWRFGLSWIEQQGLYSTCPLGFQPPPHLLSCIGCLLRQGLNLKYVSLLLKLWSLTRHLISGNFCPFPPMNPPWVWEVQMTITVYMNLEPSERGDLPIALFLTLPHIYIINCQLQLNWPTP